MKKFRHFLGNKAMLKENKVRQIFQKSNIFYPLRNVRFSENLPCFVFLKHPFGDSPFCLITVNLRIVKSYIRLASPTEITSQMSKSWWNVGQQGENNRVSWWYIYVHHTILLNIKMNERKQGIMYLPTTMIYSK